MNFSDPTVEAAKSQVSQGLVLQGYCNSILQQSELDFSGFTNLSEIQTDLNTGIRSAKSNADTYLNGIQNNIIGNISNISNFYNLYSAVPVVMPPDATEEQWLNILNTMKSQTDTFIDSSNLIVVDLGNLNTNLGNDIAFFSKSVSDLNAIVNGNEGILASLEKDLDQIDTQIRGMIAGTVLSSLAIAGGVFMIGVGAVGGFVTAGTSTPLVAGGVAVVAVGIGGTVGFAKGLQGAYAAKAALLQEKSSLTSEVNMATGINGAFSQFKNLGIDAMNATTQMRNAWATINGDLNVLSQNLQNGIISTDFLREFFLTAANETIPVIQQDISIIKQQMTGVEVSSSGDLSIGDYAASSASCTA